MFKRIDYFVRPTISDIVDCMNKHKELESIGVTKSIYGRLSKHSIQLCKINNIEIIIRG